MHRKSKIYKTHETTICNVVNSSLGIGLARKSCNGRILIAVRTSATPGTITLKAVSPGMSQSLDLSSK